MAKLLRLSWSVSRIPPSLRPESLSSLLVLSPFPLRTACAKVAPLIVSWEFGECCKLSWCGLEWNSGQLKVISKGKRSILCVFGHENAAFDKKITGTYWSVIILPADLADPTQEVPDSRMRERGWSERVAECYSVWLVCTYVGRWTTVSINRRWFQRLVAHTHAHADTGDDPPVQLHTVCAHRYSCPVQLATAVFTCGWPTGRTSLALGNDDHVTGNAYLGAGLTRTRVNPS